MNETSTEEEIKPIVALKVIQGGNKTPPRDEPWLALLGDGANFTAKRKKAIGEETWSAFRYEILGKGEKSACIELIQWDSDIRRDRITRHWVSIADFSRDWELLDIFYDGEQCDRSNQSNGLVEHENNDGTKRDVSVDEDTG